MSVPLTFQASSNGRAFGEVVVCDGVATASLRHAVLRRVFLGHALLWLREHNPDPRYTVEFQLVRPGSTYQKNRAGFNLHSDHTTAPDAPRTA